MSELHVGDVAAWLDELLDAPKFRMEEPENGLIVYGDRPVHRIGAAVHAGMRVLGLAVITDLGLPDALEPASLEASEAVEGDVRKG